MAPSAAWGHPRHREQRRALVGRPPGGLAARMQVEREIRLVPHYGEKVLVAPLPRRALEGRELDPWEVLISE